MPLSQEKIIKIIMEECKSVTDRYESYHDELLDTISEIIYAERQNRVGELGRIQQHVNEKCDSLGMRLAQNKSE